MRKLTEKECDRILSENAEYLVWCDGTEITKEELMCDFFLLEKGGKYSLTTKDDFYVHDIIF